MSKGSEEKFHIYLWGFGLITQMDPPEPVNNKPQKPGQRHHLSNITQQTFFRAIQRNRKVNLWNLMTALVEFDVENSMIPRPVSIQPTAGKDTDCSGLKYMFLKIKGLYKKYHKAPSLLSSQLNSLEKFRSISIVGNVWQANGKK